MSQATNALGSAERVHAVPDTAGAGIAKKQGEELDIREQGAIPSLQHPRSALGCPGRNIQSKRNRNLIRPKGGERPRLHCLHGALPFWTRGRGQKALFLSGSPVRALLARP